MKRKKPITIIICLIILVLIGCESQKSDYEKMLEFGENYTAAWNSKNPKKMASFYAEDGTLTVNNGTPAIGREQLAVTARSYMEAFPDMVVSLDLYRNEQRTWWNRKQGQVQWLRTMDLERRRSGSKIDWHL